jgi:hypothetical protein
MIYFIDTTLCDNVCQWLVAGVSSGTPIPSTNKTDRHDIPERLILLNSYTIIEPDDGQWGVLDINKSWTGMIGILKERVSLIL